MKNYLVIACAVIALVGCAKNRGSVGDDSSSQTGNDSKMPQTSEAATNNSSTIDRSDTTTPEIKSPSEQKN